MADGGKSPTDEELMAAYVGGDHAAFRMLFERYAPMLLRMARRRLPSDEEAREVVQQTFFQLNAARNDFRQGAKLRPWVVTIAMNLVREHYRKRGRRKEAPLDAAIHSVGVEQEHDLDAEVEALVDDHIGRGRQVLLHVVAHSKTGLHAPSLEAVNRLRARYGDRVLVVVDAAQGRFSRRGL